MLLNFNKIYLIESVNLKVDKATSRHLYYTIESPIIEYEDPETPKELFRFLDKIRKDCDTNNIKPIIDLSVHGLEDKSGISLWAGDIDYEELYKKLVEINIASGWNLILVTSACWGLHFINTLSLDRPCPFKGIFGSINETFEDHLIDSFDVFYKELIQSFDLNHAILKFRRKYKGNFNDFHYLTDQDIFEKLYKKELSFLHSSSCKAEMFKKLTKQNGINNPSFEDRFYFELLEIPKITSNTCAEKQRTFFMLDKFPYNKKL